jgi:hypothetical protein
MEDGVQVEAQARRTDDEAHDVAVLVHRALVRVDLAPPERDRRPDEAVAPGPGRDGVLAARHPIGFDAASLSDISS